ncbi:MAG: nucleotidyl transferase AbiEii/AbiGii toxin family protein [Acidobacteria bacterium]|nr:nucleotidyl transferase AbiEii/AbiGii toxin family protein [Acidobacteriota bacterium]
MVSQIELMALREERIGELVERVRQKSKGFRKPPIIVIGGYALRAYVPFLRYSRDCDFALPMGKESAIESIAGWFRDLSQEAKEKQETHGYLRLVQLLPAGRRRIKISLDFMEGEIRGRAGETLMLDERFVRDSQHSAIQIGGTSIKIRVPSYQDYLLLKLLSARPSDVRDIAAMVWKRGLPKTADFRKRANEIVTEPDQLGGKMKLLIADVSDPRFLDSWRGTFITEEFTEKDKGKVLKELRRLRRAIAHLAG